MWHHKALFQQNGYPKQRCSLLKSFEINGLRKGNYAQDCTANALIVDHNNQKKYRYLLPCYNTANQHQFLGTAFFSLAVLFSLLIHFLFPQVILIAKTQMASTCCLAHL